MKLHSADRVGVFSLPRPAPIAKDLPFSGKIAVALDPEHLPQPLGDGGSLAVEDISDYRH